jgi:hypothetical protein
MDMSGTIEPRSDQLNAEDLLTGPRTFTITDVRPGSEEQPVRVFLAEGPAGRPWIPAKTMRRLMVLGWGPESDAYIGKRVTLYRDPDVRFGKDTPGGIRISHMSGIGRKPLVANLTATRGKRVPWTVQPIPDDASAPSRTPGPLDHLVWAMNAARVDQTPDARLAYCRGIVQRDLKSAADLTEAELADVMAALKEQASASVPPVDDVASERPYELSEAELAEIAERELGEQNHG